MARASQLLAQAENPIIVVGDRVAQSGAMPQLVRMAELLGARVYAAAFSEVNFPTSHPLYSGALNTSSPATRQLLASGDVVIAVGANVFSSFLYVDEPFLGHIHWRERACAQCQRQAIRHSVAVDAHFFYKIDSSLYA